MTLLLALLFLLRPVFPVLEYVANYSYIAKELCENRGKPKMHCNGKCHLMKQLAKASEQEKPLTDKKQLSAEHEVLFLEPCWLPRIIFTPLSQKIARFAVRQNLFGRLTYYSLLRPPVHN